MIVPSEDVNTKVMEEAILSVKEVISKSRSETFRGLQSEIESTLHEKRFEPVRSGCELFMQRITKHLKGASENETMNTVRKVLEARCQHFFDICTNGPVSVVNDMLPFVRETSTVLVHGQGHLLANAVACSVEQRPGVKFFFCEGSLSKDGVTLLDRALRNPRGYNNRDLLKKSCFIIPDSAVASVMSKVDFVIAGANCVTEHGGLVHSTGSLQVAMVADTMHIPFYVLCETFKFSRIFPLSTSDIAQPTPTLAHASPVANSEESNNNSVLASAENIIDTSIVPLVEFVPPTLVSLVFTEEGIMPPSAVADEMFRIHTGHETGNI